MKIFQMRFFLCLFYFLLFAGAKVHAGWLVKEEFLSPEWENFDCHSSNILETAAGKYCAVWKGGYGEGNSNKDLKKNVGVWISLFNGKSWSEPREIVSSPESVCWTPVLCKGFLDELLLFYRMGPNPRSTISFLKRSYDGGERWTAEEMLPAGIAGPTKNKPVLSSFGNLIIPSSVEVGEPEDLFKATACWIEMMSIHGEYWKKIGPLELTDRRFGVIEPALYFDGKGKLCLLCRDRANRIGGRGFIWKAVSEDEGLSWSEFKSTGLPNPDSGIDVVDLGKGKIVLFYHHSHTDRYPLSMTLSLDGGETWFEAFTLSEAGESPSAILSSDGFFHVTYAVAPPESKQRRIKHLVIDPEVWRSDVQ